MTTSSRRWYCQSCPAHPHDSAGLARSIETIAPPTSLGSRVSHKIDLRIAPAFETLRALSKERNLDLSFIDADKTNYARYYEELLTRTRSGGVILVDNVLWSGSVIDPENQHEQTRAIRAFNDHVAGDDRVEGVMLAISDGLTLLRVK
ncbi:MAG: class I SAM-dependent methyltransferase [Myxococcales bacterium]